MASSAPTEETGQEEAGSQVYFKRHYFEKIFKEGWSFSGFERDKVFINNREGKFVDISGVSGADSVSDGRGVAFGDYDNDGDTDIFLHTTQGARHLLFRNDVGSAAGSISVALRGVDSNRDGIGATVVVTTAKRPLAKLRSGGSGFLSSHDPRLLFGLGEAAAADRVEVFWPSGKISVFEDVPVGANIRITEGETKYETVSYPTMTFADPPPEEDLSAPLIGVGDRFPKMDLADLGGRPVKLESYRKQGGDVLVNLWATWCVACKHEMPVLEELAKKHASCLDVVGVSLDFEQAPKVKSYIEKSDISYPIVLSDQESPLLIFREESVTLPASFLVGPDGKVKSLYLGGSKETLEQLTDDLAASCR